MKYGVGRYWEVKYSIVKRLIFERSIFRHRIFYGWIAVAVFPVFAIGLSAAAIFRGEIGDSSCALNVHSLSRSHQEMLKSKSFGTTAADCARHCVAHQGSSFVLVQKNDVYYLDKQDTAEKWAGQTVIVTGELDAKKNMIAIKTIEPAK